jgi:UDP-N-acetylmuramoyl-L-alanyl-D-glutamate--2,6-diaminopimelate ligase
MSSAAINKISASLQQLAELVGGHSQGQASVSGLALSSVQLASGDLFVAVPGVKRDGHDFVAAAFEKGASACVVERVQALAGRPGIAVENSRRALSRLAAFFSGDCAQQMQLLAVTGTNGKTTINWLLHHALCKLSGSSLRIGTLGFAAQRGAQQLFCEEGELTTADALTLHGYLARAHAAGVRSAVLEASSHALAQYRVEDMPFAVRIFTNLTRDHLDYHGSMQRYAEAKARLFSLPAPKGGYTAVLNSDDRYDPMMRQVAQRHAQQIFSYGRSPGSDLLIDQQRRIDSEHWLLEFSFRGQRQELRHRLAGDFNAYNLCATVGAILGLGYSLQQALDALHDAFPAPGRLQSVGSAELGVFVDYSHTPDSLENALIALRPQTKGKLWVLFGCGGDRDRGKRPQMGEVARRLADCVVVSSDNPRSEDPQKIIEDILSAGMRPDIVEVDRALAIEAAVIAAQPGDVILIAGKGHEDYQIIGTQKLHFSDVEQAKKALARRNSEPAPNDAR